MTGYSRGVNRDADYATIKYDGASLGQLWVARYDGPAHGNDIPTALAVDAAGNVFVTGFSLGLGGVVDYATVKYDGFTGDELWVARYRGAETVPQDDRARAIAIDAAGNVFVTGESVGIIGRVDYTTLKYDGDTGHQLWEARYSGPADGNNFARALTLDSLGNVYVTGDSADLRYFPEYATVKYDGLTGARLWVARYHGPANSYDVATAIAFDPAGTVCVTGRSFSESTLYDYATVKYDVLTGEQLWVARYDGPAHNQDSATAIAIDSGGNVFVTGGSVGLRTVYQYATVKYDGVTGAELWVARYDDPANRDSQAAAIALDNLGNPYVTGHSDFFGTTIAYDGANGGPSWSMRFDGPLYSAGLYAIAVDPVANVYVVGTGRRPGTDFDYATIRYVP